MFCKRGKYIISLKMAEGGHAMEEKGVRDRKREPEEYNFDYEELADAEVDSEQAGRRDDAV